MTHRILPAIAMLLLAASTLRADDASKNAKVEEFFRLAKMDEMLKQGLALTTQQMSSGFLQQMLGTKVPPEAEQKLKAFEQQVAKVIANTLSWEKLKPAYVKLYAEAYTEREIEDFIAFYKSPAGQSMVAKTPGLMTKASAVVQERMLESQAEVQKLMRDFIAEGSKDAPQRKK